MPSTVREKRTDANNHEYIFVSGIDRGMVFWVEADDPIDKEQEKLRPWLVVSSDSVHKKLAIFQGVPLTTAYEQEGKFRLARIRILDSHFTRLPVVPGTFPLPAGDSLALTEQVRALAHRRIKGDAVARVSTDAMTRVNAGLQHVLRIP